MVARLEADNGSFSVLSFDLAAATHHVVPRRFFFVVGMSVAARFAVVGEVPLASVGEAVGHLRSVVESDAVWVVLFVG